MSIRCIKLQVDTLDVWINEKRPLFIYAQTQQICKCHRNQIVWYFSTLVLNQVVGEAASHNACVARTRTMLASQRRIYSGDIVRGSAPQKGLGCLSRNRHGQGHLFETDQGDISPRLLTISIQPPKVQETLSILQQSCSTTACAGKELRIIPTWLGLSCQWARSK